MSDPFVSSIIVGVAIFVVTFSIIMLPWKKFSGMRSSTVGLTARAKPGQGEPTGTQRIQLGLAQIAQHFMLDGRLTRAQFLGTHLIVGVGLAFVLGLGLWLLDSSHSALTATGGMVIALGSVTSLWVLIAASAKRTRDTGVTVWWALTLLIPPVNLAATIYLFFVPTDEFAGRGL